MRDIAAPAGIVTSPSAVTIAEEVAPGGFAAVMAALQAPNAFAAFPRHATMSAPGPQ
jgi:hypothetical protein